ncbi:cryptochrome/photolyase family protein [Novispirillum sp. DQ9]|uniref:cryptochrome/photolyase family protein n=1 Tax=Novispirillum sp. DQ9 TaxID=3398612 RepID=UPI003C7C7BCD
MNERPVVVWFRTDLRTDDHPALNAAAAAGAPVVALYVLDDAQDGRPLGGASRWWLHHALASLRDGLARLGVPLVLRRGPAVTVVPAVVAEVDAAAVHWNRGATPFQRATDTAVAALLGERARLAAADLIAEPAALRTGGGQPYRVFTPFWKTLARDHAPPPPQAAPERLRSMAAPPPGDRLEDWGLTPSHPDWAGGLRETWRPGEAGAMALLEAFLGTAVDRYATRRDYPAEAGTSRLSPHLRFGEISVRRLWHMAQALAGDAAAAFLREVGWREFNHHLLFQQPALHDVPLRREFNDFPWREDTAAFKAWREGRTGFPIVDAGMRELWRTGWMHNRMRMIAASFLVKDLLVPWQWGERWFWDTLVDACPANNPGSWQWVAGCGSDAAPYFRVFNPTLQGEKFDPRGAYVRKWVPEAADGAGLFSTYPAPMVDHNTARRRALVAYEDMNKSRS